METCVVDVFNDPKAVRKIAEIYRLAFGGPPWNEGSICPVCGHTESLKFSHPHCPMCLPGGRAILMVEYWPESKVISDLYKENSADGSICLGVLWRHNLVGFAWGYNVLTNKETLDKLEASNLLDIIPFGLYFYLDECAVLPEFQRMGAGRSLVQRMIKKQHPDTILLRTLKDSQMHQLVIKLGGKELLPISKNRLILSLAQTPSNIPWGTYFPHY